MIASLSGIVKIIRPGSIVIEVGGVGLLVNVSPRISASQIVGKSVSLQTVLVVREDALTLYGFETQAARELFELLQTVTGIGPKVAQSALTIYETPELVSAIKNQQTDLLEKIPGLGKKGAQRVVLELHEKVNGFDSGEISIANSWRDQILSALLGLGFSAKESQERIDLVAAQDTEASLKPISELLRAALSSGTPR